MLRARLLGALEVELDGTEIEASTSQRPWAVFAYLALAGRPVTRAELANRFWPDVLDSSARASLRSALWALRRQLGDAVHVDGERVGLQHQAGVSIDVATFERLAADDDGSALELCRGELLEWLDDEWALSARERHRQHVIDLLERLARAADANGDARAAIDLTRRQTDRDPLDEGAHRRLMSRLAGAGDRAGALRAYRALSDRLRRELALAPSAPTRQLADSLRGEPGPAGTAGAAAGPQPLPLVGREPELAELEQVWADAAAGHGTVAVIRGEAGMGKTRLADELVRQARDSGALSAACAALDLGGVAPLSLWAELVRQLLPVLPAPAPEAAWPHDLRVLGPELPTHFAPPGGRTTDVAPDLQRTRLFEAAVAMLTWAAHHAPLLLLLDDVHSADEPSLELAGYAARRLAGLRVMMVLTRRELPVSPAADRLEQVLRSRGALGCEIDLEPLSSGVGLALARRAASLNETVLQRVVDRAEGNPLLLLETARAVSRGSDQVAPNLRGSVRAALGPLEGQARRLVEIAAVSARPLRPAELRSLRLDAIDEAVSDALDTGLLITGGEGLGFRHALLREAAYAELPEPRRRSLHAAWAAAVLTTSGAVPAEVARHLRLAGDDQAAVPQLIRAAAEARGIAALDQAVSYLKEALDIAPDRADVWLELGELEAWRVRRESAEAAFARATALLAGDAPIQRARAALVRARAYHGPICVPRAVLDSARAALGLIDQAGQPAPEERSEALAAWAWAEAVAGSVEEAERLLAELSTAATGDDLLRTYDAGHARALALMRRGQFVESYGPSIAAGEAIAQAGRPDLTYGCWANAASAAMAAGQADRALEFIDRGAAAVAGHGLRSLEIHLAAARCFVLRRLGRLDEARRVGESERALAEHLGQPELLAMARHDLGLTALEAGDYRGAAQLLDAALIAEAPISRPLTRLALAEALARDGQADRAAEQLRQTVLEPVRPSDFPEALVPRLARVQGLIALAGDDQAEATRRLQEAVAGWERLLARAIRAESITGVLADLGRPVVGLVEPERELERAQTDLNLIRQGGFNAVVS